MKTEYDVVVIGSGPAGLAASIEARRSGARLAVLDENFRPGGQLFKQIHRFFGSRTHYAGVRGFRIGETLLTIAKELGTDVLLKCEVIGLFDAEKSTKTLAVSYKNNLVEIKARKLVISTGARENVISFPGWTLPGVMGAGAAQTLMNVYRVLPGNKILVVGAGNVGLIVSYQLVQAGAHLVGIIEAMPRIGGWAVHAAKVWMLGIPVVVSHTIKEVLGEQYVEKAVVNRLDRKGRPEAGTGKSYDVDCVCLSVGLTPNTELTRMAACEHAYMPTLGGWLPIHNDRMETTVNGIYVAGDVAGVEEASVAIDEGRLAGISAVESLGLMELDEGEKLRSEIWSSLDELRSGPFGEEGKRAKEEIVAEHKRRAQSHE